MGHIDKPANRADKSQNRKDNEKKPARTLGKAMPQVEYQAKNENRSIYNYLQDGNGLAVGDGHFER
jgi:hypothetical protein